MKYKKFTNFTFTQNIYLPSGEISKQFLLADSGQESDMILIFGRLSGLNIFKNSRNWYFDGSLQLGRRMAVAVYRV